MKTYTCEHCGKRTVGPAHFKHVAACAHRRRLAHPRLRSHRRRARNGGPLGFAAVIRRLIADETARALREVGLAVGLLVLLAVPAHAAGGLFDVVDAKGQVVGTYQLPGVALRQVGDLTVVLPLLGKAPAFQCDGALLLYADAVCQTPAFFSTGDDPPLAHQAVIDCGPGLSTTAYYATRAGDAVHVLAVGYGFGDCYAIEPAWYEAAPAGRLDLSGFVEPLVLVDPPVGAKKGPK